VRKYTYSHALAYVTVTAREATQQPVAQHAQVQPHRELTSATPQYAP